jgi:hypothetical protein
MRRTKKKAVMLPRNGKKVPAERRQLDLAASSPPAPHVNGKHLNGRSAKGAAANGQKVNGTRVHAARATKSIVKFPAGQPSLPAHVNRKKAGQRDAGAKSVNGHSALKPRQAGPGRRKKRVTKFVLQDHELVGRCLAGEPKAWSQMYAKFHGTLLASIRAFLGRAGQDFHLIDEISARVWFALIRNNFELLARFDPARGCRLSTFLSLLAKGEARLLLRTERRRRLREQIASKPEIEEMLPEEVGVLSDDEFIATLSAAERLFYFEVLMTSCQDDGAEHYSDGNLWQLRHRVRRKLQHFLE